MGHNLDFICCGAKKCKLLNQANMTWIFIIIHKNKKRHYKNIFFHMHVCLRLFFVQKLNAWWKYIVHVLFPTEVYTSIRNRFVLLHIFYLNLDHYVTKIESSLIGRLCSSDSGCCCCSSINAKQILAILFTNNFHVHSSWFLENFSWTIAEFSNFSRFFLSIFSACVHKLVFN